MHLLLIDEIDNKIVLQKLQIILEIYSGTNFSIITPNRDMTDAMKMIISSVFFALYPASINL